MSKLWASIAVVLFLTGCASGYGQPDKIIVDTLGVDPYQYQVDLADCEEYAGQVDVADRTTEGTVEGGVVGAVLGAVLGDHNTAQRSAGAGAVLGGVKSNKSARHEGDRIVKRCLKGRGYKVLN